MQSPTMLVQHTQNRKQAPDSDALEGNKSDDGNPEGAASAPTGVPFHAFCHDTKSAHQRHKAQWPERVKCRQQFRDAVKSGRIKRGTVCVYDDDQCSGKIEGHHRDYRKPYEVDWLCATHHRRVDAVKRRGPRTLLCKRGHKKHRKACGEWACRTCDTDQQRARRAARRGGAA